MLGRSLFALAAVVCLAGCGHDAGQVVAWPANSAMPAPAPTGPPAPAPNANPAPAARTSSPVQGLWSKLNHDTGVTAAGEYAILVALEQAGIAEVERLVAQLER